MTATYARATAEVARQCGAETIAIETNHGGDVVIEVLQPVVNSVWHGRGESQSRPQVLAGLVSSPARRPQAAGGSRSRTGRLTDSGWGCVMSAENAQALPHAAAGPESAMPAGSAGFRC